MNPIDPSLISRALGDNTGIDRVEKSAGQQPLAGTSKFDALLESLDRLRKTGEEAALKNLDEGLRAAESLQADARELGKRLEAAFKKHVDA